MGDERESDCGRFGEVIRIRVQVSTFEGVGSSRTIMYHLVCYNINAATMGIGLVITEKEFVVECVGMKWLL